MRRIEQAAFTPIYDCLETLLAQMLDIEECIRDGRFVPLHLADCAAPVEEVTLFMAGRADLPPHRCGDMAESFCRSTALCTSPKHVADTPCLCRNVTWPLLQQWFISVTATLSEKTDPGLRPLLYGKRRVMKG